MPSTKNIYARGNNLSGFVHFDQLLEIDFISDSNGPVRPYVGVVTGEETFYQTLFLFDKIFRVACLACFEKGGNSTKLNDEYSKMTHFYKMCID
jgi:hypothetical protein